METWELPAVARGIERQLSAIAQLRSRGERVVGWKLGLGAAAVRKELGLPGPVVGFLGSEAVLPSGSAVRIGGWTRPALEPELAVHVGAGAGLPETDGAAVEIAAVGAAIEIVDVDAPREDLEAVVGGDIYQRHVILGLADDRRRGGDARGIGASLRRSGEVIAQTDDPLALTGALGELRTYVGRWVAAIGERLEPGHVIICGSIVPLVPVSAGERFVYRCEPLGELAVSFEA